MEHFLKLVSYFQLSIGNVSNVIISPVTCLSYACYIFLPFDNPLRDAASVRFVDQCLNEQDKLFHYDFFFYCQHL